ncbi:MULTISPECIES: enolase C-terminal domain-like protein [Paraburkholderia]|uniref:enolase C-terminal domain-like protein n=1 Tax=Paraburkholderia TaxID=1822464 RepID=UPI00224ED042|nr:MULTISPECIES: enolase C-terminal domain-like protein [Paraburkholderia]MCX4162787.1 dipeptide epimerase [Paraburkholderia megapolitana]MDN7158282.1 dipeptide epimerase [Paraburkholderia sp. CHISQ3]MDQ6495329.1 dipeptide epimerase [Paraburkholderia megapolitana]
MTHNPPLSLRTRLERWELASPIESQHGTFYEDETLLVELSDGVHIGRGETVGMLHLGESADALATEVEALRTELGDGLTRFSLREWLPPGSVRAVLDAALWDLESQQRGIRVDALAGHAGAFDSPVRSLVTLSPATVAELSDLLRLLPLDVAIKLKLNDPDEVERLSLVRACRPDATLVVDANGGWNSEQLAQLLPALQAARVDLVEQPLPPDADGELSRFSGAIPFAADEACGDLASLERLAGLYDFVNVKLEKCGGLTEGLQMARRARELNMQVMVGCFGGTSLSIAPAFVMASRCTYADLDAPLLLRTDRPGAASHDGTWIAPPAQGFWG